MKNYRIIDMHTHIYKEKIAAKAAENIGGFYGIKMNGLGTAEDLLQNMRSAKIEKALIHSAATTPKQVCAINDFIFEQCREHSQFIGFGTLHPDMENMENEIQRMLQMGFKGIKLHPDFQQFDIDSPAALKMYDAIADRLIILFHTGDKRLSYSSPHKLARVLRLFPQLTVIAAHFGGYSAWEEAASCLHGKRLYLDTSSSLFALNPTQAIEMIRKHGSEKMLFGTDYPMWLANDEFIRFLALPLTEEERENILYNNAANLLGI